METEGEAEDDAGPEVRCESCSRQFTAAGEAPEPCPGCGAEVDPARHRVRPHHVRQGMLEEGTGIRRRRRPALGFRRGGAVSPGEHDPELAGRKLQRLTGEWYESSVQPWEAPAQEEQDRGRWLERRWGLAVIGVLLLLLGGYWGWRVWEGGKLTASPLEQEEMDRRARFEHSLPRRFVEAGETARQFLAARSVEELLPLIRDRERVEPAVQAWYRGSPPFSTTLRAVKPHGSVQAYGKVFVRVLAETPDFRQVAVSLEETPAGWRVDWESFVAWSEVLWEDLAKGTPAVSGEPVLVRGYLVMGGTFEPPFTAGKHEALQLRSPSRAVVLPAWLVADPIGLMHLRGALFDAGTEEIEVIARVKPVPGGTSGRLEVVEILQSGWIIWEGSAGAGVIFRKPSMEE